MSSTPNVQNLLTDARGLADRALNAEMDCSDPRQQLALVAQVYATIALVQAVQNGAAVSSGPEEVIHVVMSKSKILAAFQDEGEAEDWTHEWNRRPGLRPDALIEVVPVTRKDHVPPDCWPENYGL